MTKEDTSVNYFWERLVSSTNITSIIYIIIIIIIIIMKSPKLCTYACSEHNFLFQEPLFTRSYHLRLCMATSTDFYLLVIFSWRHRRHVGAQNKRGKSRLGIRLYYYANLSHHLRLLCAPTWPSYHVITSYIVEKDKRMRFKMAANPNDNSTNRISYSVI